MSARLILGHFLPIFYGCSSKLPEIAKFWAENCDFCHSEYFSTFLVQKFCPERGGGTFNFRPILANFNEYTLKYDVISRD